MSPNALPLVLLAVAIILAAGPVWNWIQSQPTATPKHSAAIAEKKPAPIDKRPDRVARLIELDNLLTEFNLSEAEREQLLKPLLVETIFPQPSAPRS